MLRMELRGQLVKCGFASMGYQFKAARAAQQLAALVERARNGG